MTICPECHKLSRDDDFCSHCGAAVFGFENYSPKSADCAGYGKHDHDKITFDRSEHGTRIKEQQLTSQGRSAQSATYQQLADMFIPKQQPFPTQSSTSHNDTYQQIADLFSPTSQVRRPDRKQSAKATAIFLVVFIGFMIMMFILSMLGIIE